MTPTTIGRSGALPSALVAVVLALATGAQAGTVVPVPAGTLQATSVAAAHGQRPELWTAIPPVPSTLLAAAVPAPAVVVVAAASRSAVRVPLDPHVIADQLATGRGWSATQLGCLDTLWSRESGWDVHARNARSGAYGIPQALPGSRMAVVGTTWRDDATVQIRWGLSYIAGRYGSPCGALVAADRQGWY